MSITPGQPPIVSNNLGILREDPLHKNFRIAITLFALVPFFLAICLSCNLIFYPDRYPVDKFREEVILAAILWTTIIFLLMIGTRPPNPKPPVPTDPGGPRTPIL
ncbi:MAG: hypothetical protein IPL46_19125 [Saprospiraceae bacterium]|nr:hypothetical protein [Saprospiraceae bacterium]